MTTSEVIDGPKRSCIVCRRVLRKSALLRLIPRLQQGRGEIQVDAKQKNSGRGAYVCQSARCLGSEKLIGLILSTVRRSQRGQLKWQDSKPLQLARVDLLRKVLSSLPDSEGVGDWVGWKAALQAACENEGKLAGKGRVRL